jgi:hypothetical protein
MIGRVLLAGPCLRIRCTGLVVLIASLPANTYMTTAHLAILGRREKLQVFAGFYSHRGKLSSTHKTRVFIDDFYSMAA